MATVLKNGAAELLTPVAELLQQPEIRECLQWFSKERQWISDQHLALCRVPAPTFLEQKRAEWMVAQFKAIGCEARIDRGGNVVAQFSPDSQGPYLAVTAHLDTVLAPRTPEDISVDADGTMRGPGVSDNGAGLAALLAIARALKTCPAGINRASLLLVANVCEEGEGNLSGMRFLCRTANLSNKFKGFLVLDGPSVDHITCQALASRRFEVTFLGSGGHSWSDFGIGNPVHALSRTIASFIEESADIGPSYLPRTSYNFGLIDGGTSINSIPTESRAKVDIRSEDEDKIDELADRLKQCVERSLKKENAGATGGRVSARMKEIGSRPGGALAESSPMLSLIKVVDAHFGIRSHLDCASTDANVPLSMGVPAVSIGVGGRGGGAHTPAEWFHPEGRETGLKRVLLILAGLLPRE
jgi:tripeptide aminopeptidase